MTAHRDPLWLLLPAQPQPAAEDDTVLCGANLCSRRLPADELDRCELAGDWLCRDCHLIVCRSRSCWAE